MTALHITQRSITANEKSIFCRAIVTVRRGSFARVCIGICVNTSAENVLEKAKNVMVVHEARRDGFTMNGGTH